MVTLTRLARRLRKGRNTAQPGGRRSHALGNPQPRIRWYS